MVKSTVDMKNHAFIKALLFRITVITANFFILAALFGDVLAGGAATLVRHSILVVVYWYHERVWSHVAWGIKDDVETGKRALAKTVTYRLVATTQDFLIIGLVAGDLRRGIIGTLTIAIINTMLYYLFERIWIVEERWEKKKASKAEA
jgi:uncharacterized membrane protein